MTARVKKIKLFGEGVYSKSALVTRQRRLNVYLDIRKDDDKSSIVAYGTPGMRLAFNAATPLNNPARGLLGNDSAFYIVAGNQVKSVSSTGTTLKSATLGSSAGLVGMALNPTQLMVVDGSAGYVFTPSTGALVTAGGAFPNGAQTVAQCNGFFACEQPGTNQFFVSALNDGTTWNGLSFAAAVQAIDGIQAMDQLGGLLIPFSSGHCEFWQNVGSNPEPFTYIQNSAQMYGLGAVNSRAHAGDSLYFLARNNGGSFQNSAGSYQIAKIRGYSVSIVSTDDIDNILSKMAASTTVTDCCAFVYQADSHIFVQFNFPTANRSLLLDATTGLWGEAQSGITQAYAARHIGNLSASAFRQQFIADYSNGNIYVPDPDTFTDNGNVIVREIVSRTAQEEFNTFRVSEIQIDMDTGVGLTSPSSQGYAPQVALSIARDNRPFGAERLFPLGLKGQHATRVSSRRWGHVRRFAALRIRMTDPVRFIVTSAAMRTKVVGGTNAPAPRGGRRA
jgi:Phage stabilisation protein